MFRLKISLLIFLFYLILPKYCLASQLKFTFHSNIDFTLAKIKQASEFNKSHLLDASLNNKYPGTKNLHSSDVAAISTYLDAKISTIKYNDFELGAEITGQVNIIQRPVSNSFNLNKAFIFSKNPNFGEIIIGNDAQITQRIKVGTANFASAAGGVNGKYLQYVNFFMLAHNSQLGANEVALCKEGVGRDAQGNIAINNDCSQVRLPYFIVIPQLPIAHGGYKVGFYSQSLDDNYVKNNQNSYNNFNQNHPLNLPENSLGSMTNATKISYFSPRINNWQLGISFTLNANNILANSLSKDDNLNPNLIKNIIDLGVNYVNNFDNLGLAFSFILQKAKFDNSKAQIARNNIEAYETGLMLTYLGATIGGSYGWWGKSLQLKNKAINQASSIYSCNYDSNSLFSKQNCQNSNYYTAGLAYQLAGASASFTRLASNFANNQYQAHSFGIDYKLKKNLQPYIEITKFKFNSNCPKVANLQLKDNSGYVLLTGFLLSF
jgi:hypothetical protein